MSITERISAAVSYLPVIGWVYAYFLQRSSRLTMFHLKQSLSLFINLVGIFVLWVVVAWVLAWIPYADIVAIALFSIVIAAIFVGAIAWVVGIVNALRGLSQEVPLFSTWAKRLPM
jgi:uncharacterized membrane protein